MGKNIPGKWKPANWQVSLFFDIGTGGNQLTKRITGELCRKLIGHLWEKGLGWGGI